jgi:hypothetical protein
VEIVLKKNFVKNIIFWTFIGGFFGIFFGAVASVFENGPTMTIGIMQSWWWFALAGALKACTDPRSPSKASN